VGIRSIDKQNCAVVLKFSNTIIPEPPRVLGTTKRNMIAHGKGIHEGRKDGNFSGLVQEILLILGICPSFLCLQAVVLAVECFCVVEVSEYWKYLNTRIGHHFLDIAACHRDPTLLSL
jgi:hypothetical protein